MSTHDGTPAVELAAEPVSEPQQKVGGVFLTLYTLANFGLYLVVMMPALFSLPYKIGLLAPDDKVAMLGIVATIGAVVGLIAGPLAGALSDRTRTRIGRRRPWFLGGVAVLAVGAAVVGLAENIPLVAVGWVIISLGGAGVSASIVPVVAERVPEAQRGLVAALVGVATQMAGVLGYTIGGSLTFSVLLIFMVPVIAVAVLGSLFMFLIPEPHVELTPQSIGATFRELFFNPRTHRDFAILWLGKFLMQLALAFLTTYQLYYLLDRLQFTPEEAGIKLALVGGIGILVTMTFAIVSGMLSDRLARRKVFVMMSAVLSATGLALLAFSDGFGLFFAAVLFIVGAAGMFGAVDVAMASDLVPERKNAGRWMSTYHMAAGLAGAVAPVFGAALLGLGAVDNYTALFLGGAVLALATGVVTYLIWGVR